MVIEPAHGRDRALRRGVFSGSGTTSSGSTSLRVPMPVHSGQAPNGELNENDRGSSSSKDSAVVDAGQVLGERALAVRVVLGEVDEVEDDEAAGQPERGLHRVGEPPLGALLDRQPVDDHLDGVLLLLLQLRRLGQRVHDAVDPDPGVALGLQVG